PAAVEFEQIFVLDVVLLVPRIQQRTKIPDDFGALLDRPCCEEAESGAGAADAVGLGRRDGRHDRYGTGTLMRNWSEGRCSKTIPMKCQVFRASALNLPQIA